MNSAKINANKILTVFLLSHFAIWVLVPSITNHNLPLDTIEVLAWGSNLDWGFNKHPPLSAFAVEVFYQIFGSQDWAYYFLSQLCVVISFFVVWKFSEDFFQNKIHGLITVLLLEGIYFYNYTTPEFNVYVCELPFWALTVLFCWRGFRDNETSDWLIFGLCAALGVLSHYLFIYLLAAMDIFFLYMIIKKKINFKCLVSLIPFFLVLLPHLIWLTDNNYITITYGLHRTGTGDQNFLDHLFHPIIFLGKQIGILIPFFLMVVLLVSKLKTKFNFKDKKLLFLLTINIVPIILMFLTSMIMGVKIRTMWMTPFYLFFGVLLIYIFQSQINLNKLKGFASIFLILFIFSPFAYAYVSITQTDKRTDFQGEEFTKNVMLEWEKKLPDFDSKKWGLEKYLKGWEEVNIGALGYWITTIEGDEWLAGNLSYHLGKYQGIKDYGRDAVRARWIYGENLTLCGRYFSTKMLLKKKCIKLK
jgi:4-amino-4-deoxy-L-arabinose transferase-like glycosyltransferase